MDDQNRNLLLATALSFFVILVWFLVFPPPEEPVTTPPAQETVAQQADAPPVAATPPAADAPAVAGGQPAAPVAQPETARVAIETDRLAGSISLTGGRIDTLNLTGYRETLAPDSPTVTLLEPVGGDASYYALYGWIPGSGLTFDQVPGANTEWQQVAGGTL
jgi:YidC/Oxa1 family membrane protein insertase